MHRISRLMICSALLLILTSTLYADEATTLFERLDANRDGFVVPGEIKEGNSRIRDRLFRTADRDGDGKLSRPEFEVGTSPQPRNRGPLLGSAGARTGAGMNVNRQQVFRRLDRNRDGKLERQELPERLRPALPRLDRNKDDAIDLNEFSRAAGRSNPAARSSSPDMERSLAASFRRRDQNQDGILTKDEVWEAARPWFERMLRQVGGAEAKGITLEQYVQLVKRRATENQNRSGAGRSPQTADRENGSPAARLRQIMSRDTNADGTISRAEAPARLRQVFDRVDGNSDGQLDRAELEAASRRRK